jgi:hypothetical protein
MQPIRYRPHRSRQEHLQGLLQRKRFLCARQPAWECRGPRDREIAALHRQIDHLLGHWRIRRCPDAAGVSVVVVPLVIPPRTRCECLRVSAVGMRAGAWTADGCFGSSVDVQVERL